MKKPAVALGLLMFIIVLAQSRSKLPWGIFNNPKLKPTSCRAVLVPLEKRIPAHWSAKCEDNNLAVEIHENADDKQKDIRTFLYRKLANNLVEISKNSPNDSLDRVFFIRVKLIYPGLEINALTEGKYLSKLATITSSDLIAEHLKATVQIKETTKTP